MNIMVKWCASFRVYFWFCSFSVLSSLQRYHILVDFTTVCICFLSVFTTQFERYLWNKIQIYDCLSSLPWSRRFQHPKHTDLWVFYLYSIAYNFSNTPKNVLLLDDEFESLIIYFPIFLLSLQSLEQEKHMLRRKLSEAESERDLRVQELESDYNDLKSKLMSQVRVTVWMSEMPFFQWKMHFSLISCYFLFNFTDFLGISLLWTCRFSLVQETSLRHNEREKNVLVDELAAQNSRLTTQLEAASHMEAQLSSKLHELKSEYNVQHQTLQVSGFFWEIQIF